MLFTISLVSLLCSAIGQTKSADQTLTMKAPDDVTIAYEVHGEGSTALVFVHGWSCDRSYWNEQILPFSERYKVVTVDLGGHGESGMGREDWTISSFGVDVATVIKKLDLDQVILVGHSMGGDVIVDAALHLPGVVSGLIIVDTYNTLGSGRSMDEINNIVKELGANFTVNVQRLVRSFFLPNSDSSLVDFVVNDMSAAPPDVALSAGYSSLMHSRHITHDLEQLNLPVIAINSDQESTDVESMQQHGVEVHIMPGVGHFLMMEAPDRFNELLEKMIKEIVRGE